MSRPVFLKMYAEVVNGDCPTCQEYTMLIGLTREHYRCVTCGADLEQHVNGSTDTYLEYLILKKLKKYLEQSTEQKDVD